MRAELVLANWTLFAEGILMTLELTAIALAAGFLIALPAGLARARRLRWVSPAAGAYVYLFRGTPLLVQTFLIYYGLAQFDWIRSSWASLRATDSDPPWSKWHSMPSAAAMRPTAGTVSLSSRCIRTDASRPRSTAMRRNEVGNKAEHQPPLRPDAP